MFVKFKNEYTFFVSHIVIIITRGTSLQIVCRSHKPHVTRVLAPAPPGTYIGKKNSSAFLF